MSPTQTSIRRRSVTQASVRRRSHSRVPALRLLPNPSPAEPRPRPESRAVRDAPAAGTARDRGPDPRPAGRSGRRAARDAARRAQPDAAAEHRIRAGRRGLRGAGARSASRMAFIAGDLDDAPAESLMQTLAHRHPALPVLIVDDPAAAHRRTRRVQRRAAPATRIAAPRGGLPVALREEGRRRGPRAHLGGPRERLQDSLPSQTTVSVAACPRH